MTPGASLPDWSVAEETGPRGRVDGTGVWLGPVAELMKREQRYRILLALADALAVVVALALARVVLGIQPNSLAFGGPILAILVSKVQGLYDRDDRVVRKSTLAEWRTILEASAVVCIAVAVSWRLQSEGDHHGGIWFFLFLTGVTAASTIVARTLARTTARAMSPNDRCLIMGGPEATNELFPVLSGLSGVEIAGSVPLARDGWKRPELDQLVAQYQAHRLVLVPASDSSGGGLVETIRCGKEIGVRISIFPTVLASIGQSTTFDEVDGLPLLGVAPFGLSRSSRAVKRTFDVVIATVLLIVLSPLMALIALLIRLDSPGAALFRQTRVGRNGRRFRMNKFRSMVNGADDMKTELWERNEAGAGLFKIALDPRVTRLGRQLRRTHLDELPQLLNVIKGEMSLVGPRPLIEEEDALFCAGDRGRLKLTPGMTGPWQIRGPMTASLTEMAKLDYLYISNWTLWSDLDILSKTVVRVLARRGH